MTRTAPPPWSRSPAVRCAGCGTARSRIKPCRYCEEPICAGRGSQDCARKHFTLRHLDELRS